MILTGQNALIEKDLNNFNPQLRAAALARLAESVQDVEICVEQENFVANMHCHTFFSFNAYGHSPSSLAWLAKKNGYRLMGIVDFDTLDGVDEFLDACELLGVRGSAGLETRVFIPEFSTREINSPGEPGVFYFMGIGFTSSHVPQEVASILADFRQRAVYRNKLVLERVNTYLAPVSIDYDRDVIPLTPSANATERHMINAYLQAASLSISDLKTFWSQKLDLDTAQITALLQDQPRFQNVIRSKLMKHGGIGYIEPTSSTFPSVKEVCQLSLACGALPCATWLDGTSQGEQDEEELLDLLIKAGVVALNIIPDRNWNIIDPEVKRIKVKKLYEVVHLAEVLDLPLNIGTEMNSYGQKLIDDFYSPDLISIYKSFMDGAHFIYAHTLLQRILKLGFGSDWAKDNFPGRRERNNFYTRLGQRIPPGKKSIEVLKQLVMPIKPQHLLEIFS